MKLNSERGFGDGAFLFLFVMAALCLVAGAIQFIPILIGGLIFILPVLLIILFLVGKKKPKS